VELHALNISLAWERVSLYTSSCRHVPTCQQTDLPPTLLSVFFFFFLKLGKKTEAQPGSGGAHLWSQHLGGRVRQISVSWRPAWSTESVPGQPGLHRETLSQKKKKKPEGSWGVAVVGQEGSWGVAVVGQAGLRLSFWPRSSESRIGSQVSLPP
jgi:hypothetical protein